MTNTAPNSPSQNQSMEALLRQVEMKQLQMKLEVQFQKNMALFKEKAPDIYEEYINYEPKELRLSYTTEGFLNLVNYQLKNKPVYACDPKEFTAEQVGAFLEMPSLSAISFKRAKQINPSHIHVEIMNELIDNYTNIDTASPHSDTPVGLMLMTGCGLGYQLPALIEKMPIDNMVIYDPHKDSFYASLHTIDWEPVINNFYKKNRLLKLLIGVDPDEALATMKLLSDKIGLYNLVYTYVYRHFNSKKEENFIELYKKEFHLAAAGTGFFDDEQTSFAHTINNLNHDVNWFRQHPLPKGLPPAFVLGNGPSLDNHIDFIRRNYKNAIIFSCGTTIGSLCKLDIKPDFHVEMERVSNQTPWILKGTTDEFRKGITLLCLNTAPPNMIEIFDEICMAKKPNDAGESILNETLPQNENIHNLQLCNPTVVNAGLAFALHMGFKEVYLMGTDLGVKTDGRHHSNFSLYSDLEKKTKRKGFSAFEKQKDSYIMPGNFDGEVYTNPVLHGTLSHLEILLRHFRLTSGDVNCYNSNDGALIKGTQTIRPEELEDLADIEDKQDQIQKIRDHSFYRNTSKNLDEEKAKKQYLENFFSVRKELTLKKDIQTPAQLVREFNRIYHTVRDRKKSSPLTELLLRGSMNGYFTLMIKQCLFYKKGEQFNRAFKLGRSAYMSFLKRAYQMMETDPLKHDDTPDQVLIQLQGDEENEQKQ